MLKIITFFVLITSTINAQYLWHKVEEGIATTNITYTGDLNGIFTSIYEDTNISGSKFVREAEKSSAFTYFTIYPTIEEAIDITVTLDAYINLSISETLAVPDRLRLYFKNTTTGDQFYEQVKFTVGQEWETLSFSIDSSNFTSEGLDNGGYDQIYLGYGNGDSYDEEVVYYLNNLYGSIALNIREATATNADWIQGSWGGRLYVRGGEDLDDYVDDREYNYVAGAQEMVDNYTTMGHVITNATNNANSHLWTLRTNENVDAVMGFENAIVDEEFVPSIENEQIIIDVINTFKEGNKKVILYLNSQSPANRATEDGAVAWNNYVDTYWEGDGHQAWMNYCEGYIKRFNGLGVDGYWLDSFGTYNVNQSLENDVDSTDEQKEEFIQMIRDTAPDASIAANADKDYFVDEDGEYIWVDSDGVDDTDETDYRIIKMTAVNPWSDFTAGHITPLGQGAPPNSFAYEEFTVPDIEDNPISFYGNIKETIKHLFLPMRATWSSERSDLMFDEEQAYRFAKRITDAGGAVTFSSTTSTDGTTSEDEVAIFTFINEQLSTNQEATEYTRPEGATLVGEVIEEEGEGEYSISPNPASTSFTILKDYASLSIYNFRGKKILYFSENEKTINVSLLANGLYFLNFFDNQGNRQILKFIKE